MRKYGNWILVGGLLLTGSMTGTTLVWAGTGAESMPPNEANTEPTEPEEAAPKPHFEQSLEVTTHPALLEENSLDGRRVRAAEIPDLGTALRSEPGLGAARRGPINLEPQVRGLAEGQLLVLVDGTRTFAAGPGRMDSDLSHVGPRAVETVRVVKGPYALAWGPGAFGAIDVVTFSPPASDSPRWGAVGGISYASNGGLGEGGVTLWSSSPRWRYWAGHQAREGSDYETGDGATVPGDFESAESRWGLGWEASISTRLEYRGNHQAQDDVDYAGRLLDATLFRHTGHQLELDWSAMAPTTVLRAASLEIYSNEKRHRMNNDEKPTARPMPGRIPPFAIGVDLPTRSDTVGLRTGLDFQAGNWSLRAGGDYTRVEQSAVRTISRRDTGKLLFEDRVWPDAEIGALGLYLQATHPLARGLVSATVRLDANDATATDATDFFLANTEGSLDQEDRDLSVAVSGLWRLRDDLLLTAGAGRVVRYPTALERYSDRFPSTRFQIAAEFLGDPALAPETALQLDIGFSGHGDRSTVAVDVYHRTIDDYITVRLDPTLPRRLPLSPTTVYRYTNGDEATFFGAEFSWMVSLTDSLQATVGASYLRGDDATFDEPAFGVPPLQATAGVRWEPLQPLFIEAVVTWTDAQDRVATRRRERPTPGREVVDLLAGWQFSRVEVRGGVRNLFDEEYADHLNTLNPFQGERISEPGRSVFLGLEFSM